ncbi:hypothetical protein ETD86_11210 [Nonomuraea turkmeniaca]|uniref:Uncharacterized protein n=1 Tax=Nonomuraea turkmeniaca TaxID=103838 RepID=A0A5S4FPB5_9ACTN|nr:hypothetical protein [Nonomuraea turkmeniaca]TMR22553.1 hypothetical protein ETD86_11210 [Nonomuraea turkmeniaca]
MRLLTLLTAAVLPLAVAAAPAAADPAIWKWRPVHSADGMAGAWGKVAISQFGYVVYGNLEDTRGKGCAWAVLRAQDARNGRWKVYGFYNCKPGTGTFRKDYGSVLQIKVQVCRGTAKRPTGECSKQKTILTTGG